MKEYKRMTEYACGEPTAICDNCEYEFGDGVSCTPYSCLNALTTRLAELEDDLESGKMIRLPCKVGDTVYFVYETDKDEMFIDKGLIQSFSYDEQGVWFSAIYENLSSYWHTALSIGDTVFLTKAEAKNKLKELKGE